MMKHFRNLAASLFRAWLAVLATTGLIIACLIASHLFDGDVLGHQLLLNNLAGNAVAYAICTLVVMTSTWLVVSTPYYFLCMRVETDLGGWIHPILLGLLGLTIGSFPSMVMTNDNSGVFEALSFLACIAGATGGFTLQKRSSLSNPPETTNHKPLLCSTTP